MLNNDTNVAIYDTVEKRLIGVFRTMELAGKYLYKEYSGKSAANVSNALYGKHRMIKDIIFDFPVAVRMANDIQRKLLGSSECFITQNYPQRMNEKGQIKR
jgi:hypothetical protein